MADVFTFGGLARYRAAVYFPWDYGMLVFSELYNMGVPCLLPSLRWQSMLVQRMLRSRDFGWWQGPRGAGEAALALVVARFQDRLRTPKPC